MQQKILTDRKHYLVQGDILRHGDNEYIVAAVLSDREFTTNSVSWFRYMRRNICIYLIDLLKRWA